MTGTHTVQAIGPAEMATGFALAGVPVEEAASIADGVARVAAALVRGDAGVLLVDEAIVAALPDDVRRRIVRNPTPVIVPVPPPRWEEHPEDVASYILELLQRAIGYRMRLR